jgi:hypothetical protein
MRQVVACVAVVAATAAGCTGAIGGAGGGSACTGDDCAPAFECRPGEPGPRLMRRLARAEYDNTVRAVLGVESQFGAAMVPDNVVGGFDNNVRALSVSPLLADQLRTAADSIAAAAVAKPEIVACDDDGIACAREFLLDRGFRIVRRIMTEEELNRWVGVYQVGVETAGSADRHRSGMELMLSAILQSPSFLYRSELGAKDEAGRYALSSYEIASELSYLFWAEPPDDSLWDDALNDRLKDPRKIEEQARRLLAAPNARAALDRFSVQWLAIDQLSVVAKDPGTYPELTDSLRAAMAEEVRRLVADVIQGGGSFGDLLSAQYTYANAELAQFYGVPAPTSPDASGFGRVDLSGSPRAGLLGLGAVLTAHGRPNGSSPIHRGKLVRERFLCQPLAPPPPGLNAEPPPIDPTATTREQYAQHRADPACAGCHDLMDPIGYAFEHFDGIGRFRADENGLTIDDSGEVSYTESTDGTFQGLSGLSSKLAASSDAQLCFTTEWLRFGYGLHGSSVDCLADELAAKVTGGLGIEDLLVALTQTEHFRFRRDN